MCSYIASQRVRNYIINYKRCAGENKNGAKKDNDKCLNLLARMMTKRLPEMAGAF